MAITDNKTFGWNINLKQALGLLGLGVIVAVAIYYEQLVIGYIAMTLVLCAFFMVVALDLGVAKRTDASAERDGDTGQSSGRAARQI